MSVTVDGVHRYTWAVSTGVDGTPSGTFRPQSLSRNHRSSLYGNAPMPYSIFYNGNFAIHGTTAVSQLGGRCLAWLHQAASLERRHPVWTGAAAGTGQHPRPGAIAAFCIGGQQSDLDLSLRGIGVSVR